MKSSLAMILIGVSCFAISQGQDIEIEGETEVEEGKCDVTWTGD